MYCKSRVWQAGNTEFLSMAAAFDALDPVLQAKLAAMNAVHSFAAGFKESLGKNKQRPNTSLSA